MYAFNIYSVFPLVFLLMRSCFAAGNTLSYEDSIKAIYFNQVPVNDNSIGFAQFTILNWTNIGLAEQPEVTGIYSFSSYNYLVALSNLAKHSERFGKYGDLAFLFQKFLYGGQPNNTSLEDNSELAIDLLNSINSNVRDIGHYQTTLNKLADSSTLSELKNFYRYHATHDPAQSPMEANNNDREVKWF